MDYARLGTDLKDLRRRNAALGLAVAGLSFALIVALLAILKIAGTERTVIVPPTIDKSFWVTHERASRDYLNQMASYVAYLILDVDPAVIDWKKDTLLNWVAPGEHAALRTRLELEADRLKRINAATFFRPQQLVADEARQAVTVRGRLRTLVNGQETSSEVKAYLVEFDYAGGRAQLKSFKEIAHEPHAAGATAAAAAAAR
jgi:conjugal transfer pilus assembly protein TraE